MAKIKKMAIKNKKSPHALDFNWTFSLLKKNYPDAHCALNFSSPYELLIATILSAQCTDERVNKVTPELFKRYPNPESLALCPLPQLEDLIRSTGFYKNKAKNIKLCCQQLAELHHGQVPNDMESLYALPGVGRKTANVVLGNAFNIPSGVVVDTHVTRLANRFGWVRSEDAVKIETELNQVCPQSDWVMLSHYLIFHGRRICKARNPQCEECFLNKACPRRGL